MFEIFKQSVANKNVSDDQMFVAFFQVLQDEEKNASINSEEVNVERFKKILRPMKAHRPELFVSLEQMFRLVKRAMKQLRNE